MKFQTKFITTVDPDTLTKQVNALEREGWEFVSVQLACASADRGSDPTSRAIAQMTIPNFYQVLLATLRKPAE